MSKENLQPTKPLTQQEVNRFPLLGEKLIGRYNIARERRFRLQTDRTTEAVILNNAVSMRMTMIGLEPTDELPQISLDHYQPHEFYPFKEVIYTPQERSISYREGFLGQEWDENNLQPIFNHPTSQFAIIFGESGALFAKNQAHMDMSVNSFRKMTSVLELFRERQREHKDAKRAARNPRVIFQRVASRLNNNHQ